MNTFASQKPACAKVGKLLSANLLQKQEEAITISDMNMGCEIAEPIFNLASVINEEELMAF